MKRDGQNYLMPLISRCVQRLFQGLVLGVLLASCDVVPVLTPTAFTATGKDTDAATILYITDRAREPDGETGQPYGHDRSASMAFGQAEMHLEKLAVDVEGRSIKLAGVTEHLRFPATPLPVTRTGRTLVSEGAALRAYDATGRAFQERVAQALRAANTDEVVIFVHGYKNDFGDALSTMANIWQATGRAAVPITYTWPANNPGLFGYFKDRESGEFSIFHLKETLRLLAGVNGLNKIQMIAHSRGTDVATSALREMIIGARSAGRDPRKELKIDNLVLAAPDLDFDVVRQRLFAERFAPAFECITVYMNPNDGALAFAQRVNSGTRFGRLSYTDLGMTEREILNQAGNVYFIDVSGVVAPRGHSYFRENPVVLSDIVTLLHTGAPPGGPERNMSHIAANFWMLEQFPDITFERIDR